MVGEDFVVECAYGKHLFFASFLGLVIFNLHIVAYVRISACIYGNIMYCINKISLDESTQ